MENVAPEDTTVLPSCSDCNEELVATTSDTNNNYNKLEDVCNGYNTQCVFRGECETQCYDTNSIPQDESTLKVTNKLHFTSQYC